MTVDNEPSCLTARRGPGEEIDGEPSRVAPDAFPQQAPWNDRGQARRGSTLQAIPVDGTAGKKSLQRVKKGGVS